MLQRAKDYTNLLAERLHLSDWDIELSEDAPSDDSNADVTWPSGRKVAKIRLRSDFFDSSPEEKRHTLVHELIHLHLAPAMSASQCLEPHLGCSQFRIFSDSFDMLVEYAVDGLADAIAPLLPTMEDIDA